MMKTLVSSLILTLHALRSIFQSRNDLILENLALRQQLAALKRKSPRPRLCLLDRFFWVWLRRIWSRWRGSLVIVRPETVVRWHREGFRRYWHWKSRSGRKRGRLRTGREIRELISRMAQ